jgi:hypothetical protein
MRRAGYDRCEDLRIDGRIDVCQRYKLK